MSLSFCWNYNFFHWPSLGKVNVKGGKFRWYKYLYYSWKIKQFKFKKIDYSLIFSKLKSIKYLSFFRFSYFNKWIFSNFKDKKFDFSYLDWKKLKYPVVTVWVNNNLIVFVPSGLLKEQDKDKLWDRYTSLSWFRIVKYKNFYIFIKDNVNFDFLFDIRKYINVLSKLQWRQYKIITLQIWQNPFSKVKIDNFSKDILWIELVKDNKLVWLIIDFIKEVNIFLYSEDFFKDVEMSKKIIGLFDKIVSFYKMMWAVPQDLWSLFPNYLDITTFNPYWYKLEYKVVGLRQVEICFRPKSQEFKSLYWFELKNWYWCYDFNF